jgi:hypothetical protein
MPQNDVVSVEIRFLLLRLLAEISLRIPWGGDRPRELLFLNSFLQVQLLFTTFASHAKEAGV